MQPSEHEPVVVGEPPRSSIPDADALDTTPARDPSPPQFVADVVGAAASCTATIPWRNTSDPYAVLLVAR